MKRTAFTLSEVMIALIIIGVVMALVIPVVSHTVCNTTGLQYKKVIKDLQDAINMTHEGSPNHPAVVPSDFNMIDYFINITPKNFCTMVASQLSTIGSVNCGVDSSDTSKSSNFQLINGSEFWNIGAPSSETVTFYNNDTGDACGLDTPVYMRKKCVRTIWVDLNGARKGKNVHGKDQFRLLIRYDGLVMIGSGSDWDLIEQEIIKDDIGDVGGNTGGGNIGGDNGGSTGGGDNGGSTGGDDNGGSTGGDNGGSTGGDNGGNTGGDNGDDNDDDDDDDDKPKGKKCLDLHSPAFCAEFCAKHPIHHHCI